MAGKRGVRSLFSPVREEASGPQQGCLFATVAGCCAVKRGVVPRSIHVVRRWIRVAPAACRWGSHGLWSVNTPPCGDCCSHFDEVASLQNSQLVRHALCSTTADQCFLPPPPPGCFQRLHRSPTRASRPSCCRRRFFLSSPHPTLASVCSPPPSQPGVAFWAGLSRARLS